MVQYYILYIEFIISINGVTSFKHIFEIEQEDLIYSSLINLTIMIVTLMII